MDDAPLNVREAVLKLQIVPVLVRLIVEVPRVMLRTVDVLLLKVRQVNEKLAVLKLPLEMVIPGDPVDVRLAPRKNVPVTLSTVIAKVHDFPALLNVMVPRPLKP